MTVKIGDSSHLNKSQDSSEINFFLEGESICPSSDVSSECLAFDGNEDVKIEHKRCRMAFGQNACFDLLRFTPVLLPLPLR